MQPSKKIIENIKAFLHDSVKPAANQIDINSDILRPKLNELIKLGCFKLKGLKNFGGFEVGEDQFHEYKEATSRYSGAIALLQQQHQAAIRIFGYSPNESLKQKWLTKMIEGETLMGIGTSHLSKGKACPILGTSTKEGYRVSGKVQWVSGESFFDYFVLAFITDHNTEIFALVAFNEYLDKNSNLKVSELLPVSVTHSIRNVKILLNNFLISKENILLEFPVGTFSNDKMVSLLTASFHSGNALASLDILIESGLINKSIIENYQNKLAVYQEKIIKAQTERLTDNSDAIRTEGMSLSFEYAQKALIASGAKSILNDQTALRVYKEAALLSLVNLNPDLITKFCTNRFEAESNI